MNLINYWLDDNNFKRKVDFWQELAEAWIQRLQPNYKGRLSVSWRNPGRPAYSETRDSSKPDTRPYLAFRRYEAERVLLEGKGELTDGPWMWIEEDVTPSQYFRKPRKSPPGTSKPARRYFRSLIVIEPEFGEYRKDIEEKGRRLSPDEIPKHKMQQLRRQWRNENPGQTLRRAIFREYLSQVDDPELYLYESIPQADLVSIPIMFFSMNTYDTEFMDELSKRYGIDNWEISLAPSIAPPFEPDPLWRDVDDFDSSLPSVGKSSKAK